MIAADLGRAALLWFIPLARAFRWVAHRAAHAGVVFRAGSLTAASDVAYLSFLPSVAQEQLIEGNRKLGTGDGVHRAGGRAGLGGVLVGVVTAPYAIAERRYLPAVGVVRRARACA